MVPPDRRMTEGGRHVGVAMHPKNFRCALSLAVLLWCSMCFPFASAARADEPVVQPARYGIFSAFETHDLVGIGELHEIANALAFYASLVRDPRFAAEVGHVVVEFGASQHQGILDRYLAGDDVPYSEIAKVWRNTVAWDPTVMGVGYQTFFAQVREVNLYLPPEQRIRVWLSEPPIDWATVHSREAWERIFDQRSRHAAGVIVREILDHGRKALVIYGVGHFHPMPWPSTMSVPSAGTETIGELVERRYPGALYRITLYTGYDQPDCSAALEAEMNWPSGVLVAPVRGTTLEEAIMRPECMNQSVRGIDPLPPEEELASLLKRFYQIDTGVAGDALLYLAPAAQLMRTPADPTIWLDTEYDRELRRRFEIRAGEPMFPLRDILPFYAAPPQRWSR